MQTEKTERCKVLFEKTSKEQNPKTLSELIKEINCLPEKLRLEPN
jgi:hypothetical protein